MKNNTIKIMSLNVNGRSHLISDKKFNERIGLIFDRYKANLPDIWAMQEIPTGGKMKPCVKKLEALAKQYGYQLILPHDEEWDMDENNRSIFNALLVRGVKDFETFTMEDSGFYSRYNYVRIVMEDTDEDYYVLNVHVPQKSYFPGHKKGDSFLSIRLPQIGNFTDILTQEVGILAAAGKKVLLMGDFNRGLKSKEMKALIEKGFTVVNHNQMRTNFNPKIDNAIIDHFLVANIDGVTTSKTVDQDIARVEKLTDHAAIAMNIRR